MSPEELARIKRDVNRIVRDPHRREDVTQTACLLVLEGSTTFGSRLVFDALRKLQGHHKIPRAFRLRNPGSLEFPDRIASVFPSDAELLERWHAEELEDQLDEWKKLPAAERDQRIAESNRALMTSAVEA